MVRCVACCFVQLCFIQYVSPQDFNEDPYSILCSVESELTRDERNEQARQFSDWKETRVDSFEGAKSTYTIPVVFHVLWSTASDAQIEQALNKLNDAFSGSGEFFTEYGVDTEIEFCLARTSPDGGVTSGITRIVTDYKRFDMDLESLEIVKLVQWDPRYYLNVWIAEAITGEAIALYEGETWWKRLGVGGFASSNGIFVTSLSPGMLAHECGHYLGLLHTWAGVLSGPCLNDDCLRDGDMVCDTPPDRSVVTNTCGMSSCDTDTLSNYSNGTFFSDVADANNFMDYSSCGDAFTMGQAERMHYTLENHDPVTYLENAEVNVCETPCDQDFSVSFESNNPHPLPDEPITFRSYVTGDIAHFEWYVEPSDTSWMRGELSFQPVATSANLTYHFPEEGWYSIYLKAWNVPDSSCYTTYSRNIHVTCGVDARFYPDKRIIASKQPDSLFTDSVTFINRSRGALHYEWSIRHQPFAPEQEVLPVFSSDAKDLTYPFREPGRYEISLLASDSSCVDHSNTFYLKVEDPTIDGIPEILDLSCYDQDSIGLTFRIYNPGYDTINVGAPVSFYNRDPNASGSNPHLLLTYELPEIVYGFSDAYFSAVIPGSFAETDQLYVVFNDTGTTHFPIQFPPDDQNILSHHSVFPQSGHAELTYKNNTGHFILGDPSASFQDIMACKGELLQWMIEDTLDSVDWISASRGVLGHSNPIDYIAGQEDTIYVRWSSHNECLRADTFYVSISPLEANVAGDVYYIRLGETVRLSASGGIAYLWSPETGLDDPTSSSPNASPESTTTYTVEVIDANGCKASAQVTVFVETSAFIPNLVTPNSDGSNDFLKVYGLVDVRHISLQIFNRTGNLVYSTSNAAELTSTGWDGTSKDISQPTGVYYWQVSGKYLSGKTIYLNGMLAGAIHLIR